MRHSLSQNMFFAQGSEDTCLSDDFIKDTLKEFVDYLGPREDILILPPDFTRFHSQAGKITRFISELYNFVSEEGGDGDSSNECDNKRQKQLDGSVQRNKPTKNNKSENPPTISILPALGTHVPMSKEQIKTMFGQKLAEKEPNPFLVHDWRNDVVTIGKVPSKMVKDATRGMVDQSWPAQLNKLVWEKRKHNRNQQEHKSLVLSVGQVVPHEVMGMANFNKNLFVGVGGVEAINLSHFIGAVYGMEKMMGKASNPLRSILNYASEKFLQQELDLWYILTVMGKDEDTGELVMRGLYIGNDLECYNKACELSLKVNFTMLEKSPKKIIVHLDEDEFHSTWLGNKAIYRTRMAIADDGELIILAPGVKRFGEDDAVDKLIRAHGYNGTPQTLKAMEENDELKENLSAVAHLIHGSSEGRFSITYCPLHLTKEEVEGVGFRYANLKAIKEEYSIGPEIKDGWHKRVKGNGDEEEFFYIGQPALGLWAVPSRFELSNDKDQIVSTAHKALAEVVPEQNACDNSGGVGGWAKPPKKIKDRIILLHK